MCVRLVKRRILWIAVVASLAVVNGVSVASAEELVPWWGVTTGARPTDLRPGVATNEVQRLTVSATKGEIVLYDPSQEAKAIEELIEVIEGKKTRGELRFAAVVPFNAKASVVQEALQRAYPAREVLVAGGPGDEKGSTPYEVTFPGQSVPLVTANAEFAGFIGGEGLSCAGGTEPPCTHSAVVTEAAKGAGPDGQIIATAQNRGDGNADGQTTPVTVQDKLPAGLEAVQMEAFAGGNENRVPVSCNLKLLSCTFSESLGPYEQIEVRIGVIVRLGASSGEQNSASVSGGGAVGIRTGVHPIEINGATKFGIDDYQMIPENFGGSLDTQAGSHPFQLTSRVTLNTQAPNPVFGTPRATALPKDIVAELPAGMVGNPTPFAQCTDEQFNTLLQHGGSAYSACPPQTAIGVVTLSYTIGNGALDFATVTVPIFNMVPRAGEPARFGFRPQGIIPVFLDASVRSGSDYGITVTSSNISQLASLVDLNLTFWGVPGDPRHDDARGWECVEHFGTCPASTGRTPPPFLVLPTSCERPFETTMRGDSWGSSAQPAEQAEPVTYTLPEAIDGCDRLPLDPRLTVSPDTPSGSSSTGLTVGVHVPQEAVLNAESLAESAVKDITVALPPGVAVNPSGGDGLQACPEGLVGFTGFTASEPRTATFTSTLPEPLEPGLNFCADASKIGTVRISTPLLPKGQDLTGAIYLATQNQNPFGSLIALYIIAKDPVSGVVVKLPGEVHLSETGQLLTTFKSTPQLAFEDAELHFFGGERAPLASPAHCGAYTTNATFAPWSGNEPVNATSTFNITSGPNHSPCPGPALPFNPSLTGGTTNINAGAFSPLTTTIGREDGQQALQRIELHMPPGLSGVLSGVKLCPEQQANDGSCGPESLIGEDTVSAGVGSDPVTVPGAKIYLTGPYHGAPFGLSILNPAKAGPFDLEHDTSNPNQQPACDCIVDRAKVEVDPHTAALTVSTNSPGEGYAIPHLVDGIPLQIKKVNVLVNRPRFTFNPTNCDPTSITGTISSDEGATSPVSVPFQVTNCASLKFAPKFAVATQGKTSKANGASLTVKLTYPSAPFGSQANIKQVKVELPKQLPSRLTTLQKACTAAQFNANPAGCPAASIIGHARAITPLIPVPLEGPAYFVSNGGEAFPNLIMVLQGYGVTVDLVGDTFINKAGVTSSTFKTVPDAPVGLFELTLPEGKYSALAANGNLCTAKLTMPTEFVGQNGVLLKQTTSISVTGCAKAKALTRAQKLAKALKACKKDKNKGKRQKCETAARKTYGPTAKRKTAGKKTKR